MSFFEFTQSEADQNAHRAAEEALVEAAFEAPRGGFVVIKGYANQHGEVADHLINGNCSYELALQKSLVAIAGMTPEFVEANCPACEDRDMAVRALVEVRTSWTEALRRLTSGEGTTSNYAYLAPGVATLETEPGVTYVWGVLVSKKVVVEGEYKPVKSRALTLVKAFVMRGTPCARFRRYRLETGSFESVAMAGHKIQGRRAA